MIGSSTSWPLVTGQPLVAHYDVPIKTSYNRIHRFDVCALSPTVRRDSFHKNRCTRFSRTAGISDPWFHAFLATGDWILYSVAW